MFNCTCRARSCLQLANSPLTEKIFYTCFELWTSIDYISSKCSAVWWWPIRIYGSRWPQTDYWQQQQGHQMPQCIACAHINVLSSRVSLNNALMFKGPQINDETSCRLIPYHERCRPQNASWLSLANWGMHAAPEITPPVEILLRFPFWSSVNIRLLCNCEWVGLFCDLKYSQV